jgi:hypothetical protein
MSERNQNFTCGSHLFPPAHSVSPKPDQQLKSISVLSGFQTIAFSWFGAPADPSANACFFWRFITVTDKFRFGRDATELFCTDFTTFFIRFRVWRRQSGPSPRAGAVRYGTVRATGSPTATPLKLPPAPGSYPHRRRATSLLRRVKIESRP